MTPRPFEDWWADVQVAVERIGRAELAALVRSTAAREMGREVYAERVWDALEVAALRASVEARKRHRAYTHTPVTQSPVREILAVVPESDLHAFQTRLAYNEFARRRAFPNFLKAGWRPSKAELHAALNPEKVRDLARRYIEHVRDDELRALELWRNPVLWAEGSTPEQRIDALRPLYEVTEIQRIYRYLEWAGLAGPIGDPFQRTYDDQTDLVDLLKGRVSYLDAQLKTKRAKDAAAERDRWRR